jgi:hypothetical protein
LEIESDADWKEQRDEIPTNLMTTNQLFGKNARRNPSRNRWNLKNRLSLWQGNYYSCSGPSRGAGGMLRIVEVWSYWCRNVSTVSGARKWTPKILLMRRWRMMTWRMAKRILRLFKFCIKSIFRVFVSCWFLLIVRFCVQLRPETQLVSFGSHGCNVFCPFPTTTSSIASTVIIIIITGKKMILRG